VGSNNFQDLFHSRLDSFVVINRFLPHGREQVHLRL
jgi:hypothetical protein